jgi:hypothetical protein
VLRSYYELFRIFCEKSGVCQEIIVHESEENQEIFYLELDKRFVVFLIENSNFRSHKRFYHLRVKLMINNLIQMILFSLEFYHK